MKLDVTQVFFWFGLALISWTGGVPPEPIAVVAFIATMVTLLIRCRDYVPFAELAATIAVLQWVFAPVLGYAYPYLEKYTMYVESDVYFGFAIPATCVMNAALLGLRRAPDPTGAYFKLQYSQRVLKYVSFLLIIAGLSANLISRIVPPSVAFVFHLLSQLPNVAALILIYHQVPRSRLLILMAMAPVFISAGQNAMFHSLLIWTAFLALYWLRSRRRSVSVRLQIFVLGAIMTLFVQFFKLNYREVMQTNPGIGRTDAMAKAISIDMFTDERNWLHSVIRFNQGWIVSAIMNNVPEYEPYARGKTIVDAAVAAVVPRVILPNKATAGGRSNFMRFTGLYLSRTTSMGVSPLGEAYANFGRFGGIVMMLVWGCILAGFIQFLSRFAARRPLFHFLIPLILYQGIKAETEFLTIFNQFTKGFALALLIYWGMKKFGRFQWLHRRRQKVR